MNGIYCYRDSFSNNFYGAQKDSIGVPSFGEGEAGEFFWANHGTGRVYRITDSGSDFACLSIVSQSTRPAGRVTFTWGAASGRNYLPEVSTDMVNWFPAGPAQPGTASFRLTFSEAGDPPAGTGRRYFRAREL
jgi:hypothetical protein